MLNNRVAGLGGCVAAVTQDFAGAARVDLVGAAAGAVAVTVVRVFRNPCVAVSGGRKLVDLDLVRKTATALRCAALRSSAWSFYSGLLRPV